MNHMQRQRVRAPQRLTFGGADRDRESRSPITFILGKPNEVAFKPSYTAAQHHD